MVKFLPFSKDCPFSVVVSILVKGTKGPGFKSRTGNNFFHMFKSHSEHFYVFLVSSSHISGLSNEISFDPKFVGVIEILGKKRQLFLHKTVRF